MAIEVFKLFGSIMVDNDKANKSISDTDKKAEGLAGKFLSAVGTVAKFGTAVVAAAGTAAVALGTVATKAAIDFENQMSNVATLLDGDVKGKIQDLGMEVKNLSTGQKQRTSIARCLVHNPSIYIFDEPTLGLDVISSKSIIDFMKNERDKGKTVLYSTHYMEEAEILCDKIYMMHKGEFIAYGSCEELKNNYNTNSLRDIFIKLASERGDLIEE